MVISQTQESTWLHLLRDLPLLDPVPCKLLFVAPHPDDETLAAGGLIAALRSAGVPVQVLAVTDGENAYPNTSQLAGTRRIEQTRALERLGVGADEIVRMGLPDSGLVPLEREIVEGIVPLIAPDTHILAPWTGDFHPDHEVCGRAAREAARVTGAPLTYWLFWAWHRGDPDAIARLPLRRFALTPEQLQAKCEALLCHQSQLAHESGEPILPEDLLAPARRPFEVYITP